MPTLIILLNLMVSVILAFVWIMQIKNGRKSAAIKANSTIAFPRILNNTFILNGFSSYNLKLKIASEFLPPTLNHRSSITKATMACAMILENAAISTLKDFKEALKKTPKNRKKASSSTFAQTSFWISSEMQFSAML